MDTDSDNCQQAGQAKELKETQLSEANTCIGLGLGVGTLGLGGAILSGAVCPVCYFAVPGLIGVGLWKRRQAKKRQGITSKELSD